MADNLEEESNKTVWEHEDLASIKIKAFRGHKNEASTVRFCRNESSILSASFDHTCKLWDVRTSKVIANYAGHHANLSCAPVQPGDQKFLSCGWDRQIMLWDFESGKNLWNQMLGGIVTCGAFSNTDGGNLIVACSDFDHNVVVYDVREPNHITVLSDLHSNTPTSCMFFANDGRIVTTDMAGWTKIYDLRSAANTISLNDHGNVVSAAAVSPDCHQLVTASWDKSLLVYDISTGNYRSQQPNQLIKGGHEGCISCCAFGTDNNLVASGGYDKSIVVWDLSTGAKKLKSQFPSWINDIKISKNDQWLLSASKDGTVRISSLNEVTGEGNETSKNLGLNISKCISCGKSFSYASNTDRTSDGAQKCVFCRMANPQRNVATVKV